MSFDQFGSFVSDRWNEITENGHGSAAGAVVGAAGGFFAGGVGGALAGGTAGASGGARAEAWLRERSANQDDQ